MSQQNLRIRAALAADAELLAELGARTFSETFAADNTADNLAEYLAQSFAPELQVAELAEPNSVFLIAEVVGVAVGYARLKTAAPPECIKGEKPIELVRLYVAEAWLGQGVGAALMQACISEAEQRGYRTLWLGVWEQNNRARAFYQKWNFRDVGQHIFQLGADAQTDRLLERPLGD